MGANVDQLHAKAKRAISAGEAHLREAADCLGRARELGASQRASAKAIGKSAAWVCRLLQWRERGYKESPFGPQSKERNARRVLRQPQHRLPTTAEQVLKLEAQKARAQAVTAMFGATISNALRAQLVNTLAALSSDHPAERVRARLGMTWDELIVAAAAESGRSKAA